MAAQLIAEEGPVKGLTLTFGEGTEWLLGRDPDTCQFVIEDPKTSRQHALCRKTEDGIVIQNLSHTNPVFINGRSLIDPYLLREGDRLKIGSSFFRYADHELSSPPELFLPLDQGGPDENYQTIFQDVSEATTPPLDLGLQERWLLKILSGPQTGAEFSMQTGKSYIMGTDASSCDIIFYDLSVSRQHCRMTITEEESCLLEDLGSRNGTLVDGTPIEGQVSLTSQQIVSLGTTSFILIDREQASETIFAAPLPLKAEEKEIQEIETALEKSIPPSIIEEEDLHLSESPSQANIQTPSVKSEEIPPPVHRKPIISLGALILTICLLGVLGLLSIGTWKLFTSQESVPPPKDYTIDIQKALAPFSSVSYTFNKSTGTLFLLGHIMTPVDKNQLTYNLKGLNFVNHIDDTNVVVDQLVWQEMNNLISKNPTWNGINMYASKPGHFVLAGYLKTRQEGAALTDYINRNFSYLDRLENRVIVEEDLTAQVQSDLLSKGLNGVTVQVTNGELSLSGFIPSNRMSDLRELLALWKTTPGVRVIKNFVVALAPEEAIINLSSRYTVSGSVRQDDTSFSVIINGHILTRGDQLDGMTITSIQPTTIFLEKDGLKFKINYNPQ